MPSIQEILLRVTGDTDDAEKDLATLAAELSGFDREEAEATLDLEDGRVREKLRAIEGKLNEFARDTATAKADLDTREARGQLQVLQAGLDRIDGRNVSPDIDAYVTQALLKIEALNAELDRIDSKDVDVDVNVRRDVAGKILALSTSLGKLADQGDEAAGAMNNAAGAGGGLGKQFSVMGVSGQGLVAVLAVLIPSVTALAGAAAALVASLLSAAGAVGALGVALGSTLIPVIGLAVGAIARFKATSDQAGSAAAALKDAFGGIKEAFLDVTKAGADNLFEGLAAALASLKPVVKELGPMFTNLGKAGGQAARILAKELASPAMVAFLKQAGAAAADLAPIFARSFGAIGRILANISRAAMPFLIAGFREVAGWLGKVADKTGNIGALRRVIGGMVKSLSAWGDLLGGIVDLTAAFVQAFAPFGDQIVRQLGDGARNLADWLRSSDGLDKIKQFFEDTGPLAAEIAKLVLNIALAFAQLGQFLAPALTPIVKGFNEILGVLNDVLSWLNDKIPNGVRAAAGSLVSLFLGFGKLKAGASIAAVAIRFLIGVAGGIGGAFSGAVKAAVNVARGIINAMRGAWSVVRSVTSNIRDFTRTAWGSIRDFTRRIWQGVRDSVREPLQAARDAVRNIVQGIRDIARNVWQAIRDFTRSIWQGIRDAVRDPLGNARDAVRNITSAIRDVARNAWQAVREFTSSIWGNIREAIQTAMQNAREVVSSVGSNIREAAVTAFRNTLDAARSILSNLRSAVSTAFQGAASAVRSAGSAIVSAARSIWDQVKSVLSVPISLHIEVPDVKIPNPFSAVADAIPTAVTSGPTLTDATGSSVLNNNITVQTPDGDLPDVNTFVAQLDARLRLRGAG